MGRPAQYSMEDILDAAAQVAADCGPRGATIGAVAKQLDAPTGSIYHRFSSRDVLLAELWLQIVEAFQFGFESELAGPDALESGLRAALYTPRWVRDHPVPAKLLLVHHRDDFLPGGWPPEVAERARKLGESMGRSLKNFSRRALGTGASDALRRARYAVIDLPGAVVRPHLRAGEPIPAVTDALVRDAYFGVMVGGH